MVQFHEQQLKKKIKKEKARERKRKMGKGEPID